MALIVGLGRKDGDSRIASCEMTVFWMDWKTLERCRYYPLDDDNRGVLSHCRITSQGEVAVDNWTNKVGRSLWRGE